MKIQLTHDTLYKKTEDVKPEDYKKIFGNALEIQRWMKSRDAYAVASNQLGQTKNYFVASSKMNLHKLPDDIFINPSFELPVVYSAAKIRVPYVSVMEFEEECCLSYPGEVFRISRYGTIIAKWYSPRLKKFIECQLEGFQARIFQHELTHLAGIDETTLHTPEEKPDEIK